MEHCLSPAEFKFAAGESEMTFSGYGAVFGNVDMYGDVIVPGAFRDTLAETEASGQYPAMLMQHGSMGGLTNGDDMPIGIWTALAEDARGLKVTGKLADTPRGREAYALMKMRPRSALNGLSIGYQAKVWDPPSKPGDPRRRLKQIDLVEISLVTFPANRKATIDTVKAGAPFADPRSLETALRDQLGLSIRQAKRLVAGGWAAMSGTDNEPQELAEVAQLLKRATDQLKA